jgi:hypothetical protein
MTLRINSRNTSDRFFHQQKAQNCREPIRISASVSGTRNWYQLFNIFYSRISLHSSNAWVTLLHQGHFALKFKLQFICPAVKRVNIILPSTLISASLLFLRVFTCMHFLSCTCVLYVLTILWEQKHSGAPHVRQEDLMAAEDDKIKGYHSCQLLKIADVSGTISVSVSLTQNCVLKQSWPVTSNRMKWTVSTTQWATQRCIRNGMIRILSSQTVRFFLFTAG